MITFFAGLALGALVAWAFRPGAGGIRAGTRVGKAAGAHLLPEPALRWLLRAHGALGVWMSELDPGEEGPRNERVVEAERLSVAQIAAVDRRLERARDAEQHGAEQLEGGTLVFRAAGGFAVGLLLPASRELASLHEVEEDLDALLEGLRRRPQIVALAQAQADEGSKETVASVALRLAYQLERVTGAAAVVAVVEPGGVKIVGASGAADRRLLETFAPPDSGLAKVARGEQPRTVVTGDPAGSVMADRRQRPASVLLLPLVAARGEPVGAVALWLAGDAEPVGSVLSEILEAIANAAPRLGRATHSHGLQQQTFTDPLTGLANRRALEEAMRRHPPVGGALVYADLDNFKALNDALGHPAGDAALVHFGRLLREQIRAADTAARIGGEEFALWLPEAALEVGLHIAERIRLKLATTAWDWQGRSWRLSASFGVASCPETSGRIENLATQADAALYVAKTNGRDRVEAAGRTGGRAVGR